MSTKTIVRPEIQQAFELYSQALDHLDSTLAESVCRECEAIFGDLAKRVSFASAGESFFVEVKGVNGQTLLMDDPQSPLVLTCALYFSLLGEGAYSVDLGTRSRVSFES